MRSFHKEKLPGLVYFGLCSVMLVFLFVLRCFCYFPFQTSSLVASEILRRQSPSARATVIEKWAAVGEVCRNLHNFNTVLEISSAFMSSSIFRLKKTWEKVSKQVSRPSITSSLDTPPFWSLQSDFVAFELVSMCHSITLYYPKPNPYPIVISDSSPNHITNSNALTVTRFCCRTVCDAV